jgi:hypothetical protein
MRYLKRSCLLLLAASALAQDSQPFDFFESKIRPVLIESCYPCHSTESGKAKAGLLVDSAPALLQGGDHGPAIIPGNANESWLVKAITYSDPDLQMPPASHGGQLPQPTIENLITWINQGAQDPRTKSLTPTPQTTAINHWAFQPLSQPNPPPVQNQNWPANPIDQFILAKLEATETQPAPPADPRTLLRRLHYNLTGLPPSPQQVDAFLQNPTTKNYAATVEQLLNSTSYGERWARHWLDVARYADTKGYVFQEERRYPYAYTYRDYVIQAFKNDKPYNQFLIEQIAADQLNLADDKTPLAAMGFLTLGRRFLNNQNDIIDDRIDVITRGTLGLTVACSRCHDHKFDPVPKEDYYALHGVLASSEEPEEKPLLKPLDDSNPQYQSYLQDRQAIEKEIDDIRQREVDNKLNEFRQQAGSYLLAALDYRNVTNPPANLEDFAGPRQLTPIILQRWIDHLNSTYSNPNPATLPAIVLHTLLQNPNPTTPTSLPGNPAIAQQLTQIKSLSTESLTSTLNQALNPSPETSDPSLLAFLQSPDYPATPPRPAVERLLRRHVGNLTVGHRQRIEALSWTHPGAPARAMVLQDKTTPSNSRVFLRGNPNNPGDEVPRRFLTALSGPNPTPFSQGSGRLELAQAIASPNNPLTARVIVNRIWTWHFGRPLVSTPSDFGVRTPKPLQQDLLDYLATQLIAENWSIKSLHRTIVLSQTFQQSSEPHNPATLSTDPDNHYLSRFNRQRLDFESLRDTLLAVAGNLDAAYGGLPVDITSDQPSPRRTIYGFIDRQNLPGMFRTFDFANPDTSRPQRFQTTVPQQALFLMNSPFAIHQARTLAHRTINSTPNTPDRITALYQFAYQRHPSEPEQHLAQQFLANSSACNNPYTPASPQPNPQTENTPPSSLQPWEQLAQAILLSNELSFLD